MWYFFFAKRNARFREGTINYSLVMLRVFGISDSGAMGYGHGVENHSGCSLRLSRCESLVAYLLHGRFQCCLAWDISAAIHHCLDHVVMAVFIAKLFAHSLAWNIAAAIDHFLNHWVKLVFICTACSMLLLNTNCMEVSVHFSLRHCCCHLPLSEPCWCSMPNISHAA